MVKCILPPASVPPVLYNTVRDLTPFLGRVFLIVALFFYRSFILLFSILSLSRRVFNKLVTSDTSVTLWQKESRSRILNIGPVVSSVCSMNCSKTCCLLNISEILFKNFKKVLDIKFECMQPWFTNWTWPRKKQGEYSGGGNYGH